MKNMSMKYIIGLQNLRGKSFNDAIQRLVDTLPVDQKPVQMIYDDAGELIDVRLCEDNERCTK